MTLEQLKALYKLYPQVTNTKDGIAYDKDGSEIAYDLQAVTAQAQADEQAQADAKQAALNKLMALGLTEEEALALGK
jgi:predicted exporter